MGEFFKSLFTPSLLLKDEGSKNYPLYLYLETEISASLSFLGLASRRRQYA
jgi:hypothetical protein